MVSNPIIAALDVSDADEALRLAERLAGAVGAVKIGKELFVTAGPDIVRRVRATGAAVFLDLKFHDIPNTVAKAVAAATRLDVQMLTIHTSGGADMMGAAEKAAQDAAAESGLEAPLVLGVTVLTSMDAEDLAGVGVHAEPAAQVERLARLAADSGLRGLVCSPLEIVRLREVLPRDVRLVTPGIRPADSSTQDQKRVMTPADAIRAGADWLVIGRPITQAADPRAAAEAILASLG
ncbi:MAG: orotidine-5'-phosphate decarboxylase [Verrucomicrobiae bacterium]|jgi:orotidine-5'-phosphate decarboxylase|nr:orotidine-5'-phosphate decarboxylase [Verrucomicrobiae bacterium]